MADDIRPVEPPPGFVGGGGSGGEGYPYTPTIPPEGVPADYLPAVPGSGYTTPPPAYAPPVSVPGTTSPATPSPGIPGISIGGGADYGSLGPMYAPGSGRLSERELARLLGERVPQLGILGSLFGRRVYRPGKIERAITRGIRGGIRSAVRAVVSRFPQPVIPPPKGGLPMVIPQDRIPIGWKLGGAIGAVLGLAIPTPLGSGEVPLGGMPPLYPGASWPEGESRRRQRERAEMDRLNREILQRGTIPGHEIRTAPVPEGRYNRVAPPQRDESFRGFMRRELQGLGMDFGYDWLRRQVPGLPIPRPSAREQREVGPPQPEAPAIPQVNVQSPAQNPAAQQQQQQRQKKWIRFRIGLGAVAAGALVETLFRNSQQSGQLPITPPAQTAVTPVTTPTPTPTPLTMLNAGFVGFGDTSSSCSCGPRGPRRKCLERAAVRWATGRRKGKNAGTKCVRYAARRTR